MAHSVLVLLLSLRSAMAVRVKTLDRSPPGTLTASQMNLNGQPHRCAYENTVILTVATSASYLEKVLAMAEGAKDLGIPCVVTAVSEAASKHSEKLAKKHSALSPLFLDDRWGAHYKPSRTWCENNGGKGYGWRMAHILKTSALKYLLGVGLDVILMDTDWALQPDLNTTEHPTVFTAFQELRKRTTSDVVLMKFDRPAVINFGLLYIRATGKTQRLAGRLANRTALGWDQAVFNEELVASDVRCCFAGNFQWRPGLTRDGLEFMDRYFTKGISIKHTHSTDAKVCDSTYCDGMVTMEPPNIPIGLQMLYKSRECAPTSEVGMGWGTNENWLADHVMQVDSRAHKCEKSCFSGYNAHR